MQKPTNFQLFFFLLFIAIKFSEGTKLYVFGDSFVDNGNTRSTAACWREPYGMTFPGKPSGRFTNGLVFSDFIAQYLGLEGSPVAYQVNKENTNLENGVNFAHGGTGVFDTRINEPNMTSQIDLFQHLLDRQLQTGFNLSSSIALLSISGNDYVAYIQKSILNIYKMKSFIRTVVKQLTHNIKRLKGLGVQKIAVGGMGPIGCYPAVSFLLDYMDCIAAFNAHAKFHNKLLDREATHLNNVVVLDMYNAFKDAFKGHNVSDFGRELFLDLKLEPCCYTNSLTDECGDTEDNGKKKYRMCPDPQRNFFFDKVHPSQYGWSKVFGALKPSLGGLKS